MKTNYVRNSIIILIIIIIIIILALLRNTGFLKVEILINFIESFGMLAPIVFIIIYIIATLFGVSAIIFTILAGTIFGLWLGWFLVVISATISANLAFIISRYSKKTFFNKQQTKKDNIITNLVKTIEGNAKKNGFITIVLLRMSFLPYIPLSYAAGLVKNLKMRDFTTATFLTNTIGSFFFIFLGFSITQSIPYLIVAIILIILFSQIPRIINKINSNKNQKTQKNNSKK